MKAQPDAGAWLPSKTVALLERAAKQGKMALGERLVAALLVGSALHPERPGRAQHPELLLVTEPLHIEMLEQLAEALEHSRRAGVRLRVVTRDELLHGADVFALELAEWKTRHWLLAGEDVLNLVRIEPRHLRHALEFKVRGVGRRLRTRCLAGLAHDRGLASARTAVQDALDTLLIVAHHTLAWHGDDPPAADADCLRALGTSLHLDVTAAITLVERIQQQGTVGDVRRALATLLPFIDQLAQVVDALEGK